MIRGLLRPCISNPMPPKNQDSTADLCSQARNRLLSIHGEPLFIANWDRVLFLHYEVDPESLRRAVPYQLDLFFGRAFVSLVAFTLRDMRFRWGGRVGQWLSKPVASNPFLNVRTYVRCGDETGIHFMREWLPNRLAVLCGPLSYALPYKHGHLRFKHEHEQGRLRGTVETNGGHLVYEAETVPGVVQCCRPESLDEFLIERYTAYTAWRGNLRFFRVWHEPWPLFEAQVVRIDDRLSHLAPGGVDWMSGAELVGSSYSPGLQEVWMGRPHSPRG